MKHLANGLTLSRIVLSFMLISVLHRPAAFIVIYAAAGFTDVLDGRIARKTNTVSDRGAKLDSMADHLMFGVVAFALARWAGEGMRFVWPYLAGAIAIRVSSAVYAACKFLHRCDDPYLGQQIDRATYFCRPLVHDRDG